MSSVSSITLPEQPHATAGLILSLVGWLFAVYFYGVGVNLLFLLGCATSLWVVLLISGPGRLFEVWKSHRLTVVLCVAFLLVLFAHHAIFSISLDTSFSPTILAGVFPLVVIVGLLVGASNLFMLCAATVFVFAVVSTFSFLVYGMRAHAPLFDPNNYVALLYLCWVPWVLGRHSLTKPKSLLLTGSVSLVVAIAMFASYSRFAMLVALGVVALGVWGVFKFRWPWKYVVSVSTSLVLAFVLFASLDPRGLDEAFDDGVTGDGVVTVDARGLMFDATLQAMRETGSWRGTGLFTFPLLYPQYRSSLEQSTAGQFVHNDYLQIALEGGVWLGLPLFLFALYVVWRCVQGLLISKEFTSSTACFCAIGIALVHATVNFVFYILPLVFLLGVLTSLALGRGETGGTWRGGDKISLAVWAPGVLGWGLALGMLAVETYSYGVFSGQEHVPFVKEVRQSPQRMLGAAEQVLAINASRGVPWLAKAQLLEQVGGRPNAEPAQSAYVRGIAVDPWNPLGYTAYYTFLQRHPQVLPLGLDPQNLLDRALQLNPTDIQAHALKIDAALAREDSLAALEQAQELLQWCEWLHRVRGVGFRQILERLESSRLLSLDHSEPTVALVRKQLQACVSHPAAGDTDGRRATWMMRWLKQGAG